MNYLNYFELFEYPYIYTLLKNKYNIYIIKINGKIN